MRKLVGINPKMIGSSPAFQRAVEQASMAARSDARVLLIGESGTGKELLAARIHQNSPFAAGPFGESELRGDSHGIDRKRIIRPREGRVYRRYRGAPRQVRTGR
jgi:two-component system response regulator HydG